MIDWESEKKRRAHPVSFYPSNPNYRLCFLAIYLSALSIMPRISAEQRQKLKAELLESDDDMDDILRPSLLHPSNRKTPQVSPQSSSNNKEEKVETETIYTRKELEEQGP
jgi:hypothetical protein